MHTSSTSAPSATWLSLPAEMKLSVIEQLELDDVKTFATLNHQSYALSIPSLWRSIGLHNIEAVQACAQTVNSEYLAYTRHLVICTKSSKDTLLTPHKVDAQIISQLMIDLFSNAPNSNSLP
ncbi:hypothetical protein QCA50_002059 [Cerrena zonata]|uniref:F-box domain-containing protein n=1 Tax=Cerrena zonata TaxID=2478898 RepID=A0AAW0GQ88_9APHY